jgi:hypothetical protein
VLALDTEYYASTVPTYWVLNGSTTLKYWVRNESTTLKYWVLASVLTLLQHTPCDVAPGSEASCQSTLSVGEQGKKGAALKRTLEVLNSEVGNCSAPTACFSMHPASPTLASAFFGGVTVDFQPPSQSSGNAMGSEEGVQVC